MYHTTYGTFAIERKQTPKKLNCPVAKIKAVHTRGRNAKCASSDMIKELKAELLLAKGCYVMLTANL